MNRRADATDGGFWADSDADVALERFRTLVNAVSDGIYQLDPAGRFTAVNDVIVEMTGYERAELLGEHVSFVLEDDDVDRVRRAIEEHRSADGRLNRTFDLAVRTADGETIHCEIRLSVLLEDGTFEGTVGTVREVSDRNHTEQRLLDRDRQLRLERDLTDQILETSPIGIQVLDSDGEVTRMNDRLREMLEIPEREEHTYDPSNRSVYDETGARISTANHPFAITLETGEPVYDRHLRVDLPSGDRRWLSINAAPLFDDAGAIERVVTTGEDITDLKERERALERRQRELTAELDEIYGRITDGVIALNDDWEFTHVNENAEVVLDAAEDELLGRVIWDAFPELVNTEFERRYREAMTTQEPVSLVDYFEPHDAWFEEHVYPSETGISIYFRDVTEHRERERKLEKSEQRHRTLAEYFPNGLVTLFDDDLTYTLAAGQGFDRIPVDPADLEENRACDVWSDETWSALEPAFRAAIEGEERSVELSYADREWVLHAVPITDERGDVFAGMTMAQDITERKEYERKLEDTVERLEESNERLEQFAYAASHDLQEPLRMVSSYLRLLEQRYDDELDEDGEEFLAFAVDGADRMREMIDGLLAYSRVDTESGSLEPVDLDAILDDALDNLRIQIDEAGADITRDDLPRVDGDATQLQQVFQNLLDNAITYSGDDPPRIRIEADRQGAKPVISIEDNGIGIAPDDQDRIFTIFNRLHSREEHDGAGIGLALCQRIVDRHGGDIWVRSTPGEGTTFSFSISRAEDRGEDRPQR
ncbi:PAS domain-containing sensor histidine kinase [Natronosalvus rutilus]|uniref:histidine kinase n=1 Tax=Natronosalvus rutilus TaxID=2953753 RepID=A0A9E7NCR7_9EURY|nr:PAS domain S-box protein [Natronosalvus rutilus]UTF54307.1 PAS domain-containing protein [Natronosalvus rutilus]